jgi:hypothetical protein
MSSGTDITCSETTHRRTRMADAHVRSVSSVMRPAECERKVSESAPAADPKVYLKTALRGAFALPNSGRFKDLLLAIDEAALRNAP